MLQHSSCQGEGPGCPAPAWDGASLEWWKQARFMYLAFWCFLGLNAFLSWIFLSPLWLSDLVALNYDLYKWGHLPQLHSLHPQSPLGKSHEHPCCALGILIPLVLHSEVWILLLEGFVLAFPWGSFWLVACRVSTLMWLPKCTPWCRVCPAAAPGPAVRGALPAAQPLLRLLPRRDDL